MPSTEHLHQQASSRPLDREFIANLDATALFGGDEDARRSLITQIRQACREPGFFYLHNTCVEDQLIRAALEQAKQFFDSPDDGVIKQGVHNEKTGGRKGWGPMFAEPAYQQGTVAHLESFDIGQQLDESQCRNLRIEPNIWPDLPGFRDVILDYYDNVTRLGRALSEVFSEFLGMDQGFINASSRERAPRTMRLLHYPANDAPANERNVGIAAHTDFECFTIIYQTAAGLELTNRQGQWYQAPSDIGTFTILLGDMLERLSNGHLSATGHRVLNTAWTRYSMVLFFALDGDFQVSPLPGFISRDQPARYAPVTQDEHIERELKRARAPETPAI